MEFIILIATAIAFIYINKRRTDKLINSQPYIDMISNINNFSNEIELYKKEYFTFMHKTELINKYQDEYSFFSKSEFKRSKDLSIIEFNNTYSDISNLVKKWNEEYINKELASHKSLFDDIDGKSLDNQQRRAVVVDEMNNLVLAGAGSDKTLTISGKVKYLVDVKNINPEEILLISFTKKAAKEMTTRIDNKLNINIESKTFHKLGLDIITEYNKKRLDIEDNLNKIIDEYFTKYIFDDDFQIINMINFFSYYLNIPKNMDDYKSLGELYEEEKSADFGTLQSKYNKNKIINDEIKNLKIN